MKKKEKIKTKRCFIPLFSITEISKNAGQASFPIFQVIDNSCQPMARRLVKPALFWPMGIFVTKQVICLSGGISKHSTSTGFDKYE